MSWRLGRKGIDLSGHHAVVTGANTGIGYETSIMPALSTRRWISRPLARTLHQRETRDGHEAHFGIKHLGLSGWSPASKPTGRAFPNSSTIGALCHGHRRSRPGASPS